MQAPVQPGDVLAGKYRVERVLGQGGMGIVVAARHLELDELYAIKFLLPHALSHSQAVDRFLREARASARLKGEHVAKVHDVGRLESGAPYMVLEFLAGSDLQQLVRKRGPLPWEEAATYMLQTCEAIAEAHALGIVHRDLKPANLFLIQRPNGTPCVKVLDFGISKQAAPDGVDLTRTGMALGSPLYMSPEQMVRSKDADARSDIWSLGVVFYELLIGAVPFLADTLTEVVGRVLQEEHAPPSRVRPDLPAGIDEIVAGCLQKRPEHRFQSVEQLAAALRQVVGWSGTAGRLSDPGAPGRISLPGVPRESLPSAQPGRASLPSQPWAHPGHPSQPDIEAGGPPQRASLPSQPVAGPGHPSQPDIGAMGTSQPAVAAPPGSSTASSWGKTGAGPGSPGGVGKRAVAAGVVLTIAALGGLGVWLARGSSGPAASVESQPGETALQGAEMGAPATPEMPVTAPSAQTPAPVVVEPSSQPVAANASAAPISSAASPVAPSRPTKSTGNARGGSTAAPTAAPAPTTKPTAMEASPPPSTSAPRKPKHEGIF
jgi:serine/threonine-protein kinase